MVGSSWCTLGLTLNGEVGFQPMTIKSPILASWLEILEKSFSRPPIGQGLLVFHWLILGHRALCKWQLTSLVIGSGHRSVVISYSMAVLLMHDDWLLRQIRIGGREGFQ